MVNPPTPPEGPKPNAARVRVHLSTAENVGKLFGLDWCVIVGSKDGETRFIPWVNSPGDEAEARRWLGHLAELLSQSRESPSPKGP